MKLTLRFATSSVVIHSGGEIEIDFVEPDSPDYRLLCLEMADRLGQLLLASDYAPTDELLQGLRECQSHFVEITEYEPAAICRSARLLIERLVAMHEVYRTDLRKAVAMVCEYRQRLQRVQDSDRECG